MPGNSGGFATGEVTTSVSWTAVKGIRASTYATSSSGGGPSWDYRDSWIFEIQAWGTIAPTVTTQAASDITASSATLNGNITDAGGENCTTRGFQYGKTGGYGSDTHTDGSYSAGAYTASIGSLDPNTTYYFRAYATNSAGTSYGSQQSFSTLVATPTVSTSSAAGVGTQTATLNGNITNIGGENCTVRGFQYGLTGGYGLDTHTHGSYTTGAYSIAIAGLSSNALYHFKAYATNSAGTGDGSDATFTTMRSSSGGSII